MIRNALLAILQVQSLAVAGCSLLKTQETSSSANRRNGRRSRLCEVAGNSVAKAGRNVQSTKYEQMKPFFFHSIFFSFLFFSFVFLCFLFFFFLSFFFFWWLCYQCLSS
ncbi:hypothetical protein BDW67DRAFT_157462, partial [Aspergillus spinulosporus]